MKKPRFWSLVTMAATTAVAFLFPFFAHAETVINASAVGSGNAQDNGSPYGGSYGYVGYATDEYVAWIKFVTSTDAGTIASATLEFDVTDSFGGSNIIDIFTMNKEIGSGATWLNSGVDGAWVSGGGKAEPQDRTAVTIGSATLNGNGHYEISLDPEAVRNELNGDKSFGLYARTLSGSWRYFFTNGYLGGTVPTLTLTSATPTDPFVSTSVYWSNASGTASSVSSTFEDYVTAVMGTTGTLHVPGCYINGTARLFDVMMAMTRDDLVSQGITINPGALMNIAASGTMSTTSSLLTLDLETPQALIPDWFWTVFRPIVWNIFEVFAYAALGWVLWNDWIGRDEEIANED